MTPEERAAQLEGHFRQVRDIIEAEEMWERVPERAREFSPENLEGLVKFAYFGGFIDMAGVRRLLVVDKTDDAPAAGQVVRGGPGAGLLALLIVRFSLKNLSLVANSPFNTSASPQSFKNPSYSMFIVFY